MSQRTSIAAGILGTLATAAAVVASAPVATVVIGGILAVDSLGYGLTGYSIPDLIGYAIDGEKGKEKGNNMSSTIGMALGLKGVIHGATKAAAGSRGLSEGLDAASKIGDGVSGYQGFTETDWW